jgi:hypothetical protein
VPRPDEVKVYCEGCRFLVSQPVVCIHPDNIMEEMTDSWLKQDSKFKFIESPQTRNADNNCDGYEKG